MNLMNNNSRRKNLWRKVQEKFLRINLTQDHKLNLHHKVLFFVETIMNLFKIEVKVQWNETDHKKIFLKIHYKLKMRSQSLKISMLEIWAVLKFHFWMLAVSIGIEEVICKMRMDKGFFLQKLMINHRLWVLERKTQLLWCFISKREINKENKKWKFFMRKKVHKE